MCKSRSCKTSTMTRVKFQDDDHEKLINRNS